MGFSETFPSVNASRSSLIGPGGHKSITVNTVSHDVLVWVQGRNIFFMANRTQPQELITQKCSSYGQVDLQTDFGTNFQPATDLKKTFIDLLNNF